MGVNITLGKKRKTDADRKINWKSFTDKIYVIQQLNNQRRNYFPGPKNYISPSQKKKKIN